MKSFRIQALLCLLIGAMAFPAFAQSPEAVMTRGASIYNEYCKACHQANGQGLGVVFPPVAKSDYLVTTNREQIIMEVVNGKKGKMKVNGKDYNGVMTPLPAKYTAEDVAAVLTYMYGSFGNKGGVVTAAEVRKAVPKRK